MPEIGQNLKSIVLKGIDLIGSKANNLASTARQKMDVYNLENERKNLLEKIGSRVYELNKEGVDFPETILDLLQKVRDVDLQLSVICADEITEDAETDNAEEHKQEETEERNDSGAQSEGAVNIPGKPAATEYTAEHDPDIPVIEVETEEQNAEECPLSSAINDLFEMFRR